MTIWEFLNSNLGLLILGFVFTTIIGALISWWLQRLSWQRQTRIKLYTRRYDEGIKFLNDLADLIGKRYYGLQQWLWAIGGHGSHEKLEREYFVAADEWNIRLRMNRSSIRLLIGEKQANRFLNLRVGRSADYPLSIHDAFVKAHRFVLAVHQNEMPAEEAQRELDTLNSMCTSFLEGLTDDFLERAASLRLFKPPASENKT